MRHGWVARRRSPGRLVVSGWSRVFQRGFVAFCVLCAFVACNSSSTSKKSRKSDDDDDDDRRSSDSTSSSASASSSGAAANATGPVKLTKASKRIVTKGLTKDLQVDVYLTRGTPRLDAFAKSVDELFSAYRDAELEGSKSRLKFKVTEPKTEAEKSAAAAEGLKEQAVAEPQGSSALVTQSVIGFVLKYGAEKEVVPFWPPESTMGLEYFITTKIKDLRDRTDGLVTHIGIVANKKELNLDTPYMAKPKAMSIRTIFGEYFKSYQFVPVDLKGGDAPVDESLPGVIVTQPREDYTDKELKRLDEFLMRGDKALVFYTSSANVAPRDQNMAVKLDAFGLPRLLAGYGIELVKDVVLDFEGNVSFNLQTGGKAVAPALVVLDDTGFDAQTPVFFRLNSVAFPFTSSIVLHEEVQPTANLHVLARTHASSATSNTDGTPLMLSDKWVPPGTPMQSRIISVSLEGTVRSAFDTSVLSKSKSRVLVVSSSQFLWNPFVIADTETPETTPFTQLGAEYAKGAFLTNLMSFKGTLDWMAVNAEAIELAQSFAKKPGDSPALK